MTFKILRMVSRINFLEFLKPLRIFKRNESSKIFNNLKTFKMKLQKNNTYRKKLSVAIRAFSSVVLFRRYIKEREGTGLAPLLKSNISGEKLRVAIRACSYFVVFLRK